MTDFLYATVSEIKERLYIQDNDRDRQWTSVARAASRWVDDVTGHRFYSSADIDPDNPTEVRYYQYAAGCDPLRLDVDDVLSIDTLTTDENGDGVFEYTWAVDTDYWLGPRNAPARNQPYTTIHRATFAGRYWFPSWPNSVRVEGNFGYCSLTDVPHPVRELTLMVAAAKAHAMLDLTMAGVHAYQAGPELRVTMAPNELPPFAREIIDKYRIPSYVV